MHSAARNFAEQGAGPRLYRATSGAHAILRYGVAISTVAAAAAISYPFRAHIYTTPLFIAAVVLSCWYGGTGPGIFSTIASVGAIHFILGLPLNNAARLAQFVFISAVVIYLVEARKRAERLLREARDQLEIKVAERTRDLQTANEQLQEEVAERRRAEDGKKERIRILIADDHSVLREGLASLIARIADMTVIAEARNGREAVDLYKQHQPDVALLDLRMPELDGVGAIEAIRADDEHARIIVLTTFDGDEYIYRAIRAGAKGYLLKDVPREALMDCIRRVHAGQTCLPVHLAAKLAERISGEALSTREMEVLQRMATGKSNKEIGAELFISEGTVKTHVKSIFTKLDVVSRTAAIATAQRRGLIQL
jgi:DNA-binding NarL/FixJ family response regulator